jgi:uncharacterized membrane protein YhaH (DUF805 family)
MQGLLVTNDRPVLDRQVIGNKQHTHPWLLSQGRDKGSPTHRKAFDTRSAERPESDAAMKGVKTDLFMDDTNIGKRTGQLDSLFNRSRRSSSAACCFQPWNTAQSMNFDHVQHAASDSDSWRFIFGSWRGRVSRRTFWLYGVGALLGIGMLGQALLAIAGIDESGATLIVDVLLVYPALAVSAKRWQDRNRSPLWVLVVLIPVIGWVWAVLDNGFVRGNPGPNAFGPRPVDGLERLEQLAGSSAQ